MHWRSYNQEIIGYGSHILVFKFVVSLRSISWALLKSMTRGENLDHLLGKTHKVCVKTLLKCMTFGCHLIKFFLFLKKSHRMKVYQDWRDRF